MTQEMLRRTFFKRIGAIGIGVQHWLASAAAAQPLDDRKVAIVALRILNSMQVKNKKRGRYGTLQETLGWLTREDVISLSNRASRTIIDPDQFAIGGDLVPGFSFLAQIGESGTSYTFLLWDRFGRAYKTDESGVISAGTLQAGTLREHALASFNGTPLQEAEERRASKPRGIPALLGGVAGFFFPTVFAQPQFCCPQQCGGGCRFGECWNENCDCDTDFGPPICCNLGYAGCPWCCLNFCSSCNPNTCCNTCWFSC
jgi:hypothetical protein